MIWPSINASNCWNTLKPVRHNVAGNGERDGSKSYRMKQWAISNEASLRGDERSSTRESNLSPKDKVKSSRTGRIFFLAVTCFVFSLFSMKAEVSGICHNGQVFNSVIRGISIDMVDNLGTLQKTANMLFHNKSMDKHVTFSASIKVIRPVCHQITPVFCYPGMKRINQFNVIIPCKFGYIGRCHPKDFSNLAGSQFSIGHFLDDVNGRDFSLIGVNSETLHVSQNKFFRDTILFGDLDSGLQFLIIAFELIRFNEEFLTKPINTDNIMFFQPIQDGQPIGSVFCGKFINRLQFSVISTELLFAYKESSLSWHKYTLSPFTKEKQERNQDIVTSMAKAIGIG